MDIVVGCVLFLATAVVLISIIEPPPNRHCANCRRPTKSMYRYVREKKSLTSPPYVRTVSDHLKDICSICGNNYLRGEE